MKFWNQTAGDAQNWKKKKRKRKERQYRKQNTGI